MTSGEALLTIINDILDFSKIEAGRFELDVHPFALAATIEGALDVMGPIAAKKGLELVYSLDPDAARDVVGDAGRLRQIVLNLLSNAIKFTETGEITVTSRVRSRADARRARALDDRRRVHDTGIGIPPDRIGRLFQSFSQADASISRRVRRDRARTRHQPPARRADGWVARRGQRGDPGRRQHLPAHVQLPAAAGQDAAAPAPTIDLRGRRVLVVDDNATNLRILVAQLERLGLAVTPTGSSLEARTWQPRPAPPRDRRDRPPDAGPRRHGPGADDPIASGSEAPPSSSCRHSDSASARLDAIAAFLTKPVKPVALRDTLAQVLSGSVVQARRARRIGGRSTRRIGERHPLRLLLAEDNAVNQKLAVRLLERMGYTADIAGDGLEAIDALEARDYDVVLMDVQMPELDGLEATRRIRAPMAGPPLTIIAMTANAMEGDRETCLAAGMDDYVSKPIRPDD